MLSAAAGVAYDAIFARAAQDISGVAAVPAAAAAAEAMVPMGVSWTLRRRDAMAPPLAPLSPPRPVAAPLRRSARVGRRGAPAAPAGVACDPAPELPSPPPSLSTALMAAAAAEMRPCAGVLRSEAPGVPAKERKVGEPMREDAPLAASDIARRRRRHLSRCTSFSSSKMKSQSSLLARALSSAQKTPPGVRRRRPSLVIWPPWPSMRPTSMASSLATTMPTVSMARRMRLSLGSPRSPQRSRAARATLMLAPVCPLRRTNFPGGDSTCLRFAAALRGPAPGVFIAPALVVSSSASCEGVPRPSRAKTERRLDPPCTPAFEFSDTCGPSPTASTAASAAACAAIPPSTCAARAARRARAAARAGSAAPSPSAPIISRGEVR
mmetsp:Transcript_3993/g.9687  ORF Transcript_3993/g.9687 Transcript_3993/m.9687 type:complete len:381 (-) Transcript_3993:304-1446(-)